MRSQHVITSTAIRPVLQPTRNTSRQRFEQDVKNLVVSILMATAPAPRASTEQISLDQIGGIGKRITARYPGRLYAARRSVPTPVRNANKQPADAARVYNYRVHYGRKQVYARNVYSQVPNIYF
ncbi:hypothetical protein EVAR_36366_1 [Eumeta japonica]|uniref:Uncharacterized protein n=1 Tax=Eumeta variegata TaxID=151549 RepID=A0A4C1W4C9_EUMVA|nr:hypothetical protein EVAR_36366_1 [Eumeta japonica]